MEWLQQERDKIIDQHEKDTFDEIIKCFDNNLYRAGYILTWILLIESIKRKIYELERSGDSTAIKIVKTIEAEEKAKKSTDKFIYDGGKTCGLYDESDLSVIDHLWGRRCFYAHPYQSQPTKKELEYIIEQSIKIVLSQEIAYNKNRLEEVCGEIILPHLMNNDKEEINRYAQQILSRTPIRLYPFFFKSLLFVISKYINTSETWIVIRIRALLVNILKDTRIDLTSKEWAFLNDKMVKFPEECMYGFVSPQTWEILGVSFQDMAFNYLRSCNNTQNQILLISRIFYLIDSEGKLNPNHKDTYYRIIGDIDIEKSHHYYNDKNELISTLETIVSGGQYIEQNKVIDLFKDQAQNMADYSEEQKFKLGRLFYVAARMGCWKARSFVDHLCSLPSGELDDVKKGIALNVVINSDGNIEQFFSDKVKILFQVLLKVEKPKEIIDHISAIFEGKTSFNILGAKRNIQKSVDAVKDENPYAQELGEIFMKYFSNNPEYD